MNGTKNRKTKRKLSDIDFSREDSHVALVSKEQGGPANGADYALVIKATNFSEEFIEKASKIRVTLELPEFLNKFFGMYYEDAELLARMFGYEPEQMGEPQLVTYEDYIQSKLQSFEVLKSLNEEGVAALANLREDEYLALLEDQLLIEKACFKFNTEEHPEVAAAVRSSMQEEVPAVVEKASFRKNDFVQVQGTEVYGQVQSSKPKDTDQDVVLKMLQKTPEGSFELTDKLQVYKACNLKKITKVKKAAVTKSTTTKEVQMQEAQDNVQVAELELEVVEKSKFDAAIEKAAEERLAIQKALEEQKVELQKALELVELMKAEKLEVIRKAKTEKIEEVLKGFEQKAILVKASLELESDEDFTAFVAAMQAMMQTIGTSEMFVEKGVTTEVSQAPVKEESAVAKALRLQLAGGK